MDAREWVGAARPSALLRTSDGRRHAKATEVYVGFTEEAVYWAWRVHRDCEGPINIAHTDPGRHDGRSVRLDDCIEIVLDVEGKGRKAIHFAGNAAGALGDRLIADGTDSDQNWRWDYSARETRFGWGRELGVQFDELGLDGPPEAEQTWGFNFRRNDKTPDETVSAFAHATSALAGGKLGFGRTLGIWPK